MVEKREKPWLGVHIHCIQDSQGSKAIIQRQTKLKTALCLIIGVHHAVGKAFGSLCRMG
jgi:hypothetical protein